MVLGITPNTKFVPSEARQKASLFRMLVYRLSLNYVFRTSPFMGLIKDLQISELLTHLSCNLSCEVLVLLLHTFTGLETNEVLNSDVSAVRFSNLSYILSYGLLAVLCFYINLV